MDAEQEAVARRLFEKSIITQQQFAEVKAYRSLGIFSLHNELQWLLYSAVLLFTSGAGILIYQNIDSVGHTAILALLLGMSLGFYGLSYKKSPGFDRAETHFDHPVYPYFVLLATILGATFIGYLQYQYKPFGERVEIATFFSAAVALAAAYYFDNRSALSIGITGLAATVGITATPGAIFNNNFLKHPSLLVSGIVLGTLLIVWAEYSERTNLKRHFSLVWVTFAQHLTGICCVIGMAGDFWPAYVVVLAAVLFYCYRKSHVLDSASLFVFTLIYGYIAWNMVLFKLIDVLDAVLIYELLTFIAPLYFIASIVFFIQSIKKFNRKSNDRLR